MRRSLVKALARARPPLVANSFKVITISIHTCKSKRKTNVDDVQRLWKGDGVKSATPVSKEEVRMLVAEIGYKATEERTGISANTLYQWASRYAWNTPIVHSQAVRTVRQSPADALQSELAEHERETRLSLARYARRASRDAEGASLREAPYVKAVAEVTSKVHRWDNEKTGNTFTLNVLNINALSEDEA